jgi:hypothetical protein
VIEPDRITYHFGLKISTAQFENATVGVTLSSTRKKGESLEDCFERVAEWVEEQVEEKREAIAGEDG